VKEKIRYRDLVRGIPAIVARVEYTIASTGYIKSLTGKFQDECLNQKLFLSKTEALWS
jgi:hypothetical protein